jgi:Tfp pilus assembly protein PilF
VNLAAARVAANNENYLRATKLAEQAEVEAQLSMAIVKRRDTEQALDEIQKTIRTLRDETTPNGQ